MDAINFIRRSPLCTSGKYARFLCVVDKVLSGTFADEDLAEFVNRIAPLEVAHCIEVPGEPLDRQEVPPEIVGYHDTDTFRISAIKEIQQVRNVGLIAESPPITLGQGLTVFYGYNASGKTSLYRAMANCLGLANHEMMNVNVGAARPVRVQLLVEDSAANTVELVWPGEKACKGIAVKCFDSAISLSLVQDPQDNTFSLAHLKQECFVLLGEVFANLAIQLDARRQHVAKTVDDLTKVIQTGIPELIAVIPSLDETHVETASISEEERKNLTDLRTRLAKLEKEDLSAKIIAFANDISRIDEILLSVATRASAEEIAEATWKLKYDAPYFQDLRELLNTLNEDETVLRNYASSLRDRIPSRWVEDELWMKFVNAALGFVHSLEVPEQSQYCEQRCPYCQQSLSAESRELLAAYGNLCGEIKERRDATEATVTDAVCAVEAAIGRVKMIPYTQKLLSTDTQAVDKDGTAHLSHVLQTLSQFLQDLLVKSPFIPKQEELDNIATVYGHYLDLRKVTLREKESYESLLKNKEGEMNSLRCQIASLDQRRMLVDNRQLLQTYLAFRKILVELAHVRKLLTDAKRQASTTATEFSNEVAVREFETVLDNEYKSLGFEKPAMFRLTSRTSGPTTKRVYSVADRRFHEILSEGEQKQHALADFFAQMTVESYTGLVIFDDPVTSLDECNIEKVARRIVEWACQTGNQVILFTHNIFFLNSLIEITGEKEVMRMTKAGDEVVIHPEVEPGTAGALKRAKRDIEKRLKEIEGQMDTPELALRNVYDMLSNYIETAVEINLFKEVVGRYRPNIRIQSLRKIRWDDTAVQKLVELYHRTSRKGTRHSQPLPVPPPTREGLLGDAKEIISWTGAL